MKRLLLTLTVVAVSALTMYGQGRFNWNNFSAGIQPITVDVQNQGASGGAAGDFVGSNYSVQLLWAAGTFANQAAFNAANPTVTGIVAFFGQTGSPPSHGPLVDGTGLYDGGTVNVGAVGVYTIQARAWFNGGQFADYASAVAAVRNTGVSQLSQITPTASPTPAPNSTIPAFTVSVVPEPATFVLAGLGALSLLLFRRRK